MAKAYIGDTQVKLYIGDTKIKKAYLGDTKIYASGNTVTYRVDSSSAYTEEVDADDSCLSPTTFTASKSGYTFVGWVSSTSSTSALTSYTMGDSAVTLYALFKKTITLSYSGNGSTSGSTSSQTGTVYYCCGVTTGATFTLASNGYTKTNCTFSKWALGSASGTQYSAGASVTLTASTAFYAVWTVTTTTYTSPTLTKVSHTYTTDYDEASTGSVSGSVMTIYVYPVVGYITSYLTVKTPTYDLTGFTKAVLTFKYVNVSQYATSASTTVTAGSASATTTHSSTENYKTYTNTVSFSGLTSAALTIQWMVKLSVHTYTDDKTWQLQLTSIVFS